MMPDTPKNQEAYPQNVSQKSGLGFPIAKIAAFFSLSCGAVVDLGICPYAGKGNSELGLLRKLWGVLRPGDVLLADRYMCAWTEILMLKQRGVDSVIRLNHHRKADFRRGKHLGKRDHIVRWSKPSLIRWLDRESYKQLPELAESQEVTLRIGRRLRFVTLFVCIGVNF